MLRLRGSVLGCNHATLTHARLETGVCHTPGLFRSLANGEREGSKLHVIYTPEGGGPTLEFVGAEPLGIDDLRVLQGLVGLAAVSGDGHAVTLPYANQSTEAGRLLRAGLSTELAKRTDSVNVQIDTAEAAIVLTSYARLGAEIGYVSRDKDVIRDSLKRFFLVTIFKTQNGITTGSRLMSRYESNDVTEEICVAINPVMAAAVLGTAHFLRVNLTETRLLKASATRLIHQRLSFIPEGGSRTVGMARLCEYAYPPTSPDELKRRAGVAAVKAAEQRRNLLLLSNQSDAVQAATAREALDILDKELAGNPAITEKSREISRLKKYKKSVRGALAELISLGWIVVEVGRNFKITRPAASAAIEMATV